MNIRKAGSACTEPAFKPTQTLDAPTVAPPQAPVEQEVFWRRHVIVSACGETHCLRCNATFGDLSAQLKCFTIVDGITGYPAQPLYQRMDDPKAVQVAAPRSV